MTSNIEIVPQELVPPPASALDVDTELTFLRNRRRLTRAEYEMADTLWQNQLKHARRENTVTALAALWLADLAAMYGEA